MDTVTLSLIALAIAPAVVLIAYVYLKDRYEKEPIRLLFICFVLGVLSIFPALAFHTFFEALGLRLSNNVVMTLGFAVITVGFSEEFAKFLFLRFYVYRKKDLDEPYDGIIYTLMIGMGFATAENLLYVLGQDTVASSFQVGLLRAFTAVPAHATFAIVMGYYAGLAKFEDGKAQAAQLLFRGLLIAVLLHGAYDYFLFTGNELGLWGGALVALGIGIVLSRRAIRSHQLISPFRPIDLD